MRRILTIALLLIFQLQFGFAQVLTGQQARAIVPEATMIWISGTGQNPAYIALQHAAWFDRSELMNWIGKQYGFSDEFGLRPLNVFPDLMGDEHFRYKMTFKGHDIHDGMVIAHVRNGLVYAINGNFRDDLTAGNTIVLDESSALQLALAHVNALRYKWQLPEEETLLKIMEDDPSATYYPKGEVVFYPVTASSHTHLYTWKFTVYADKPLFKKDIYIDAQTGQVVMEMDKIHVTDVPGTALTKYSGLQSITTDSVSANLFRLREAERGNGIETYNMQTGTSYGAAVDFVDADNYWNNVNAAKDEVATDAHWGAEMTYDYYYFKHGRNSIDNNGFKLRSYVHYDLNYANAFWDGSRMTYGDGSGSWSPLTAMDICAHEITHGLTTFTADLDYSYESGAMNEGYSDIFGTSVEFFAKPSLANWLIGENIGSAMRSLANPNAYGDPDTYLGNNYYIGSNDNGGVHTNSGVLNYWYYLTVMGGVGINDLSNTYNVTGIGLDNAGAVAYRTLTTYLINSSQYADARFYSILSATDLFGPCSPQVVTVTNAMYAVGIGNAFVPGVDANFTADITNFCVPPATVHFTNLSNNANSFYWDFGDGITSTQMSPSHTYTGFGTYNVKLVSSGGTCGIDSVLMNSLVSVDASNPCIVILPQSGSIVQNTCSGKLFDSGGSGNYQNNVNSKVTIAPPGASSLTLTFLSFDFEAGYDYLKIYNGPNTSSPLIGSYDGTNLPNGGTITTTGGAVTLVQTSDQGVTGAGFEMNWICSYPTAPPVVLFSQSDTASCNGTVQFYDLSTNGPTSWFWDFGDGNTSTVQNPVHTYQSNGTYNVSLIASNSFGSDSITQVGIIHVFIPAAPVISNQSACNGSTFTFVAGSNATVYWYDGFPGGTLIDTGAVFTTPYLTTTTHYYIETVVEKPLIYTAKPTNTGGGGYFNNNFVHHLVFDAYKDFKLLSVKVYAQSSGNRTITLRNSSGAIIQTKTVNIPSGEQRVTLNFDVPAGSNLQLAGPVYPGLYRNSGGTNYPYTVSGVVSVKYSSATTDPTGYYYYFYDWEIQEPPCSSPMTSVTAYISTSTPVAAFTAVNNDPDVVFLNSSIYGIFASWDFGDGGSSTDISPVHNYTANGTYAVKLVSINGCGSDSLTQNITINSVGFEETNAGSMRVYPVPSEGLVVIEADLTISTTTLLEVSDMLGRVIYSEDLGNLSGKLTRRLDLSGYSPGAYLLRLKGENGSINQKIVIR